MLYPANEAAAAAMIPQKFNINEVFESIQGEAAYTGTPSVFLRLQGCPVGCSWCDTKHTWDVEHENVIPVQLMVDKPEDSPKFASMSLRQVMDLLDDYRARHIVLTGGEPCLYDLRALTAEIIDSGRSVQVETSGTAEIRVTRGTWVTVSPKYDMPGGLPVLESAMRRADEIKVPVGRERDVQRIIERVAPIAGGRLVWLQPLSQSPKATALCVEKATLHGWRVSIQTHKFLGVR